MRLHRLTRSDVTPAYVAWLNDPEVVRYTEARHGAHTLESIAAYVEKLGTGDSDFLMGIFEIEGGRHVGNIKIGQINGIHRTASLGLVIGDKTCWNRGYASEAIRLAARHAFGPLKLHKLTAGIVAGNEASLKAFLKNGFRVEGVRRQQNLCDSVWRDETQVGLLAAEFVDG